MSTKPIFQESQKFNQWWLWLILTFANVPLVILVVKNFSEHGELTIDALSVSTGISLLVVILFAFMRLDTEVRKDGIYVRFYPFQLKLKHHPWDKLSKAYVRKYSPISEYGGWGIRFGGSGTALNIRGNMGLQLVFRNKRKLLIGTQKRMNSKQLWLKRKRAHWAKPYKSLFSDDVRLSKF